MDKYKKYVLVSLLTVCVLFMAGCSKKDQADTPIVSDPIVSTKCSVLVLRDRATKDEPFLAEVAFGTHASEPKYFDIIVESEDLVGTYPEEYVADGVHYQPSDFHTERLLYGEGDFHDKLPQKFELTLKPNGTKAWYEGSVKILIALGSPGHVSETAWETLYYCGNDELLCFSQVSPREAQAMYHGTK